MSGESGDTVAQFPQIGMEISRAKLYNLYWTKKLSQAEIAKRLDVSETTVHRAFKMTGVPKRDQKSANDLAWQKRSKDRDYTNKKYLKKQHHDNEKSLAQIARENDVVQSAVRYWMDKHGLKVHSNHRDIPQFVFSYSSINHPTMKNCDGKAVPVHKLVAIANGASPHDLFGGHGGYQVHHKNNHPADNRPENLEVLTAEEHGRKTVEQQAEFYLRANTSG